MAFFRNYTNETVSPGVLEEKGRRQTVDRTRSSVLNEDVDATSSEKEFDMNMDGQYPSEGEPYDGNRLQNEGAAADGVNIRESNLQPPGRRTAMAGKWGSTFWKDCQPMTRGGSDSGQDSKTGSDYGNAEGSEDNSLDGREDRLASEDDDRQKQVGKHRGHSDVPADDMLSDEYYEQDGEEQRDSAHYRGFNHAIGVSSRPQSKPPVISSHVKRNNRVLNDKEDDDDDDNNNDDADGDYEEEDEEDGNLLFFFSLCVRLCL